MKNILTCIFLLLVCFSSCKTIKPVAKVGSGKVDKSEAAKDPHSTEFDFSEQSTWLIGILSSGQLVREPYSTWYIKGFDDYIINSNAINQLLDINKDGISIKVIMGTWCSDSRREVPRFMRILNIWQFPATSLTIYGVDKEKQCPVGDFDKLKIERVPTFILYKNNIEVGRIIENPVTSLEQDMVNILTKKE
jgi:hypothetical protein